jgi:RNA polymerase sigma-70 factor, ECF subfamily
MKGLRPPVGDPVTPDDELLSRVAAGDNRALELLYERYARIVYGTALRMLGTAELAEDVVQETFWRVWRRGSSFQSGRGQVASWIFGIAHNLCIDELRRQRSRPQVARGDQVPDALLDLPDDAADVSGAAIEAERRQLIVAALERLPGEQRQAIELAYFGGLSQSEIAEQLQSPIGTVKTRIRLGLVKLRDILIQQQVSAEDLTG